MNWIRYYASSRLWVADAVVFAACVAASIALPAWAREIWLSAIALALLGAASGAVSGMIVEDIRRREKDA